MKDAAQISKDLEAQFQLFTELRADAAKRKEQAERTVQFSQQEYEMLGKAMEALKPLRGYYASMSARAIEQPERLRVAPGTHRQTIVEILTAKGRPMGIADIAKIAFAEKKIPSAKGYKGVYGTVATVLSRNGKHVFIHLNSGKWDLRTRRLAAPISFKQALDRFATAPTPAPGPPMPTAFRKVTS